MMPASPLLNAVISATWQGSVAILILAVAVPLLRRWLGARTTYWLWLPVVFRLLVPGLPGLVALGNPPAHPETTARWILSVSAEENPDTSDRMSHSESTTAAGAKSRISWETISVAVWMGGVLVIAGFALARSLRATHLARQAADISHDVNLGAILRSLPVATSGLSIRESANLRSPALCGLWHPTILLPLDWRSRFSKSDLQCVLLHEIGHCKRGDLVWRWISLLVCTLHWFNPLVWLAARVARNHQEMACDEWVMTRTGSPSPLQYGEALLAVSTRSPRFSFPVQAEMSGSVSRLRRRIAHLASAAPHGWRAQAAVLAAAIAVLALSAPARSKDPPNSPETSLDLASERPAPPSEKVAASTMIEIESKFVQMPAELAERLFKGVDVENSALGIRAVYAEKEFEELLGEISHTKSDLLSAPKVATRDGQRSVIQVTREFRYPSQFDPPYSVSAEKILYPSTPSEFKTRNLGVTLEVTPSVSPDRRSVELVITPEVVDFDGFINYGTPIRSRLGDSDGDPVIVSENIINQPVFSVRRMETVLNVQDGQTVLIGGLNGTDLSTLEGPLPNASHPPLPPTPADQSLFVFVTARLLKGNTASSTGDTIPSTMPSPEGDTASPPTDALPYATTVPDRPGFVTSPYAPDKGFIDVRGFPPDSEVKDPYTRRIFLVP